MTLYTPRQLVLVLLVVGTAGAGLAIDHWRRAHPDLVEHLERWDRADRREPSSSPPAARARPTAREPVPPRAPSRTSGDDAAGRRRAREPAPPAPVDINRATEPELVRLPGVGPALAARIVAARPFTEVDDLRRVRGLRRTALERLRPLVTARP